MGEVDFPGDLFLAPHGIKAHGMTLQVEQIKEFGDCGDFVGFPIYR